MVLNGFGVAEKDLVSGFSRVGELTWHLPDSHLWIISPCGRWSDAEAAECAERGSQLYEQVMNEFGSTHTQPKLSFWFPPIFWYFLCFSNHSTKVYLFVINPMTYINIIVLTRQLFLFWKFSIENTCYTVFQTPKLWGKLVNILNNNKFTSHQASVRLNWVCLNFYFNIWRH